jgi:hypothetical protein
MHFANYIVLGLLIAFMLGALSLRRKPRQYLRQTTAVGSGGAALWEASCKRLSRTSIADEMRKEHRRRVLGE